LAVILFALPLAAGTTDVSTFALASLGTGDELSFTVPSWNFSFNAANLGFPLYPTNIEFTFATAVQNSPGQFEAVLESGDGSVSVSFAPLSFMPATFQGTNYHGTVSVLQGSLQISETLSQQLFSSSAAVLTLLNAGPAVSLGLPPYTLKQDMTVSLGGGGLGVGARLSGVSLVDAPPARLALMDEQLGGAPLLELSDAPDPPDPPDTSDVPEPRSGLLLPGGGSLLWVLSKLRRS
jgi:hypothetical protein